MKDYNSMNRAAYISETFYWSLLVFIFYWSFFHNWQTLILISIEFTEYFSFILLLLTVIITEIIGILITWKRRRNFISVFVNVLIPFELYSIALLIRLMPRLMISIFILDFILILLYSFLVVYNPASKLKLREVLNKRLLKFLLNGVRTLSAFLLSVVIILMLALEILNVSPIHAKADVIDDVENSEVDLNEIDFIMLFREEIWTNLSVQERVDALQKIARLESDFLGLETGLIVEADFLQTNLIAQYDDNKRRIIFDIDYLEKDSAHDTITALCHEAYHSYQHRIVDALQNIDQKYRNLLIFHDASLYEKSLENYRNSSNGEDEYYNQIIEKDARSYSEFAVENYYKKIDSMISENN